MPKGIERKKHAMKRVMTAYSIDLPSDSEENEQNVKPLSTMEAFLP